MVVKEFQHYMKSIGSQRDIQAQTHVCYVINHKYERVSQHKRGENISWSSCMRFDVIARHQTFIRINIWDFNKLSFRDSLLHALIPLLEWWISAISKYDKDENNNHVVVAVEVFIHFGCPPRGNSKELLRSSIHRKSIKISEHKHIYTWPQKKSTTTTAQHKAQINILWACWSDLKHIDTK